MPMPDSGFTDDAARAIRDTLDAELVLPLSSNRALIGVMGLGPKRSEEPFTSSDRRLLDAVAAQTGLALENSRLAAEIAAEIANREKAKREIEIAREVQQRLFPQEYPPVPGIVYAGACRPALGVGGDYYDFIPVSAGELGIAIGDVSGKGIPAALLMATLRAYVRAQSVSGDSNLADLMSHLNRLVYESSPSMSARVATICSRGGSLANARATASPTSVSGAAGAATRVSSNVDTVWRRADSSASRATLVAIRRIHAPKLRAGSNRARPRYARQNASMTPSSAAAGSRTIRRIQ
jgi:hypothetical protein